MKRVLRLICLLTLAAGLMGCSAADKTYLERQNITEQELINIWGQPYAVFPQRDGSKIMVFQGGNYFTRDRFFVVKDGVVVDGGYRYYDLRPEQTGPPPREPERPNF